jgi:hypothetical protein
MKITLRLPESLHRRFSAAAVVQGKTVQAHVIEALKEKLGRLETPPPGWMKGFGQLRHLRKETRLIEETIRNEFSRIEPGDWQ